MSASGEASLLPLRLEALRFSAGGRDLIDIPDLALSAPGVTAVLGPNGSGKSLLLRLIHGLLPASAGRISWNGRAPDDALRREQALVFQRPVLLRRSVAENLAFALRARGLAADRGRIEAHLEACGLAGFGDRRARSLSGGEQQRLALQRALALKPKVVLLDEPTASLDPAATLAIEAMIRAAAATGVKCLLVTHDRDQARRLATDALFMHEGRVLDHAAAERFFKTPSHELLRRYIDGQLIV